MDLGGDDIAADRYAILSDEGGVKLGLTDRYVYFALSDSTMAEARSEMRIELTDPDRTVDNSFRVNDRPATDAFTEEDVRSFAEEFRRAKAERGA